MALEAPSMPADSNEVEIMLGKTYRRNGNERNFPGKDHLQNLGDVGCTAAGDRWLV
jgi:hypothetical protein